MINIIAAIGKKNELGKDNGLIWNIPKDLKFFREKTRNSIIVMGRNTFNSLPKILPGRKHIILSSTNNFNKEINEQVTVINNKEDLINLCKKISENNEVFIIGGASLYSMFIDIADVLYITHIEKVEETADVYFPKIDEAKWKKKILANDEDNNIKFSWVEYTKI